LRLFYNADAGRLLAFTLLYCLEVLPFIAYRALGEAMGQEKLNSYLAGKITTVNKID
jgi:hypothetical protein